MKQRRIRIVPPDELEKSRERSGPTWVPRSEADARMRRQAERNYADDAIEHYNPFDDGPGRR